MKRVKVILLKVVVSLTVLGSAVLLTGASLPLGFSPSLALPKLIWTHDGEHVIFSTAYRGIFVVDAAGRRLTTIPKKARLGSRYTPGNYAPALSPDGRRVAYVTYPGDAWGRQSYIIKAIETAALDGTGARRLTVSKDRDGDGEDDNLNVAFPVWSPDGSKIAFLSGSSLGSRPTYLSIMDADGSNERVLAPSVEIASPSSGPPQHWWSPDSRWLAFQGVGYVDEYRARHPLYTIGSDGGALVRIGEIQQLGIAAWSPGSGRLAFLVPHSDEPGGRIHSLYTARPDGSDLTKVSGNIRARSLYELNRTPGRGKAWGVGFQSPPAWSPDGAWLAFAKEDEEGLGIYVARPDGSDLRLVVRGHGGPVSWSSDGEELYIADLAYAIRPDGTGLRPLLTKDVLGLGSGGANFTAWSPDGSRLAVLNLSDSDINAFTLFTLARDGTDKRVLVRGTADRVVAEHSDYDDVPKLIAACGHGFVVPEPEANPGLVEDCETLLAARDTLIAGGHLVWTASHPITDWRGVEVGCPSDSREFSVDAWAGIETWCSSALRVTGLSLTELGGRIPPVLGELSALESLRLYFVDRNRQDRKVRRLPPELGKLTNLRKLHLYQAHLSGTIPPELGNLTNLRELYLHINELSGAIPPELGNLANLRELYLSRNELSGAIPPELGNLAHLRILGVGENELKGAIPAEFGNLANLVFLSLYENSLTGPIPPELGRLKSLEWLYLYDNQLTGAIPLELGNLNRLVSLGLSGNALSGAIPVELGNLANLKWLSVDRNSLTGSIPPELGNLKSLTWLEVTENALTGSIPTELAKLEFLGALLVSKNNLTGCVPAALSRPTTTVESDDLEFCE